MSKISSAVLRSGNFGLAGLSDPPDFDPSALSGADSEPAVHSLTAAPDCLTQRHKLRASVLSPVFPFGDDQIAAAEQYRIVRTKLLHHPAKPGIILVSSASIG